MCLSHQRLVNLKNTFRHNASQLILRFTQDMLSALPSHTGAGQPERSPHPWPGFVASHCAATHPSAVLRTSSACAQWPARCHCWSRARLCASQTPGNWPNVRSCGSTDSVVGPQRRAHPGLPNPAFRDLLPEFEQAPAAFRGQFSQQAFDFVKHPQPFFGQRFTQFFQAASHPSPDCLP